MGKKMNQYQFKFSHSAISIKAKLNKMGAEQKTIAKVQGDDKSSSLIIDGNMSAVMFMNKFIQQGLNLTVEPVGDSAPFPMITFA
jgi:hypothetical protein